MATESLKLTDYLYLNTLMKNTSSLIQPAEYNTNENLPIMGEIQDFKMAVVRMRIPTGGVPLFLFEDDSYLITFGRSTSATDPAATTDVISPFTPPLPGIGVVSYKSSTGVSLPGYENTKPVHYYSDFLSMINEALNRVWTFALTLPQYTLAGRPLQFHIATNAPYLRWDCGITCFELVIPTPTSGTNICPFYPANPLGIKIILSSKLFTFLNGFPAYYYGEVGLSPASGIPLNYHLNIYAEAKDLSSLLPAVGTRPAGLYYCIKQDFSSTHTFQQVVRILLTTTVAVVKETIFLQGSNGIPNKLEVLTDLELEATGDAVKEYVIYNPTGEFRYHNFKDQGEFRRFDLKVYVEFINGGTKVNGIEIPRYIPLSLLPGEQVNVKFGFVRREHNDLKQNTVSLPKNSGF